MKECPEIDMFDWEIVELLRQDGRISMAQLARKLRMSHPSVADRIGRLETAVIVGYRAEIDVVALGFLITAIVRVHLRKPDYDEFVRLVSEAPEVRKCLQVAEPSAFQLKVTMRDIEHLRRFAIMLNGFGGTATSIVLSYPLKHKHIERRLRQGRAHRS